jgi:cysteinyl-tRNA synthetase
MEGLHQAQQSVQRLRNFRYRLTKENFQPGESHELKARAEAARQAFDSALDDNLNTAEALAAVFDLVRDGNIEMDGGRFSHGDRPAFLDVLERWDRIFAILEDTDYEKLRQFGLLKTQESANAASGHATGEAPAVHAGNGDGAGALAAMLDKKEIENRIAARESARHHGDYSLADEIRGELLKSGVILEDTKAGTRWKRK